MTSSVYIGKIGALRFEVERKDKDDYNTEYVSSVIFRNAGYTIFGTTPYWQAIDFGSNEALDELIMALTYVKMMRTDPHRFDFEGIAHAAMRCNNECKAIEVEDGWECKWCGVITNAKYTDDDKPKRCSGCGAFFKEYEARAVEEDAVC